MSHKQFKFEENSGLNIKLCINKTEENDEEDPTFIIKKLISKGTFQANENEAKQIEIHNIEDELKKPENIIKVELEDIEIIYKQEEDFKFSCIDIQKDILLTFLRNKEANNKK